MATIAVSDANKHRLGQYRIPGDRTRDSYNEALGYVLDEVEPAPTPEPPKPTVLKQYVILAVPRDRLSGATIMSPSGNYGISAGIGLEASFGPKMNEWLRQQNAGFQCEWEVLWAPLPQTLDELQAVHPEFPEGDERRYFLFTRANGENVYTRDEFGLGFHGTNVLNALGTAEGSFQYAQAALAGKSRVTVWVIGGGAWHGGSHNLGARNVGYALNGDDDFSPRITGKVDPTSANTGTGFQTFKPTAHEWGHGNGMYVHARDTFDKPDHPADGGPYEPIAAGFTSFPLSTAYDSAGNVIPLAQQDDALKHHVAMERKLYAGQISQMHRYSEEWLVRT